VLGFASFLFLHSELWGAPFFLAGLVAVRRGDDRTGAALMAAATVVRELFGLGLVLGLVLARRRRPWVAAGVVVGILVLVHAALAAHVLAAHGYEAAFGNEKRTASFLLTLVSPGGTSGEKLVGVFTLVAGIVGAFRAQATDRAARLGLVFGVVMLLLTMWSTRRYWSPVWAPTLACFVPAALRPPPWRVSAAGPS
jgi:hypothetical protein